MIRDYKIYDVRERGTYKQYWIPKGFSSPQEKVERQLRTFIHFPFNYGLVPVKILDADLRTHFMIQNYDLAFDIWLGNGIVPLVGSTGVRVKSELAFEPLRVPQNEVWVVGTGAGKGEIIYSLD
jgi:hypothetical protein